MADGLGALPRLREDPQEPRTQSQTTAELARMADVVRDVADQIDPREDEEDEKDDSFDENLAERLSEDALNKIGADLRKGIESDLQSRKDWEEMVERAIKFLGLIYEEASGELSSEGSISKAWHTLMLEASVSFWANANAEFLPADGPVKIKDDKTQFFQESNADANTPSETQMDEAFETAYNHYLTVTDKQYYRDFSRMLWSLGPKGTEFRKIYYNPLRRMPVSEWVKSENLIISNDAADISTAERVTERILMSDADVRRMMWREYWRDVEIGSPNYQPTEIQEQIGRVEGIRPRIDRREDQLYEFYECCCWLDLPGYMHDEIPLPYVVTLEKRSGTIVAIRRNWEEDDENFEAKQRYVMFGLLPGFGLYYLGFVHVLGNTERALTALEREAIDNLMMSIFPGWLAKKGAFSRGDTQVRMGPAGVKEVDLGMNQRIQDVITNVPVAQIPGAFIALFEKLEDNGRKLVGQMELPVGEGVHDIPVGTMIAMIEQATKVMAAVHKGIHASRQEELELLRKLIAEYPEVLERQAKNQFQWSQLVQEFMDLDLVPSSDPNVPSHIHRVMQFMGLMQLAQQAPQLANQQAIFKEGLAVLRLPDPESFINPNPPQPGAMPDPKMVDAQNKLQIAQLNAQVKNQDTQVRAQTAMAEQQGKQKEAEIDQQTELLKTKAQVQGDIIKGREDNAASAAESHRDRAHEHQQTQIQQAHEQQQAATQQAHEQQQAMTQQAHEQQQTATQGEQQMQQAAMQPQKPV